MYLQIACTVLTRMASRSFFLSFLPSAVVRTYDMMRAMRSSTALSTPANSASGGCGGAAATAEGGQTAATTFRCLVPRACTYCVHGACVCVADSLPVHVQRGCQRATPFHRAMHGSRYPAQPLAQCT